MAKKLTTSQILSKARNNGVQKFPTLKAALDEIHKNLAEIHKDTHVKLAKERNR